MSKVVLQEQAAPDTPAANMVVIYPKAGGGVYKKDDLGEEVQLSEVGELEAHAEQHEHEGDDEISVTGLSGLLTDNQHVVETEVQAISINNVVEDETPQLGGPLDANGQVVNMGDNAVNRPEIKDYSETKTAPSSASNVLTLDIVNGNVFSTLLTENVTTLNFSNPSPSGKACSFTWVMTQHSSAVSVTWPVSVKWDSGTAPTITADNGIYVFTFLTVDEGTTWFGFLAGSEMAVPA